MWLIDEMYRQFLDDPDSVSEAWQEFFEDYEPHSAELKKTVATPDGKDETPDGKDETPDAQAETPIGTPEETPDAKAETPDARRQTPELKARPIEPQAQGPQTSNLKPQIKTPQTDVTSADKPSADGQPVFSQLRGAAAVVAERMEASRDIPTATSVRTIPAKLLEVNRQIINNQLKRLTQGGKVSFTHLIGWAIVKALKEAPDLNVAFAEIDGKPHIVRYPHIVLGLAIDMERKDGSRGLVVPNIRRQRPSASSSSGLCTRS